MPAREVEASLQAFGEFLLRSRLVQEKAAPYCVRWVRQFLNSPAGDGSLSERVRAYCEWLSTGSGREDWQVRQAEHALRLYFVHFLQRADWDRVEGIAPCNPGGGVRGLVALDLLRRRIRTRRYALRTETTYLDWARRFLAHASARQGHPSGRGVALGAAVGSSPRERQTSDDEKAPKSGWGVLVQCDSTHVG